MTASQWVILLGVVLTIGWIGWAAWYDHEHGHNSDGAILLVAMALGGLTWGISSWVIA